MGRVLPGFAQVVRVRPGRLDHVAICGREMHGYQRGAQARLSRISNPLSSKAQATRCQVRVPPDAMRWPPGLSRRKHSRDHNWHHRPNWAGSLSAYPREWVARSCQLGDCCPSIAAAAKASPSTLKQTGLTGPVTVCGNPAAVHALRRLRCNEGASHLCSGSHHAAFLPVGAQDVIDRFDRVGRVTNDRVPSNCRAVTS